MNNQDDQVHMEDKPWFYEKNGQRIGGVSQTTIIQSINNQTLSYGSLVWKAGFPEWMKIENTELRQYLEQASPPPLTGQHVSNSIVWVLAFAPIIGFFLEAMVASLVHDGDEYLIETAIINGTYWYITVILNIALSLWDANRLKKLGTDTKKFDVWAWLVPVYLFQRAQALNHNRAYFAVWVMSFVFILVILNQ